MKPAILSSVATLAIMAVATPAAAQVMLQESGRLQAGDAQLDSGEFVDRYSITVRAGQTVDVTVTSDEFDTYVLLRGAVSAENDDGDDGSTNSRLVHTFSEGGTYTIGVTSYEPGETGRYSLRVTGAGGSGAAAGTPARPGDPVTGTLAAGDARLDSGEYADAFTFTGRAGEVVDFAALSDDFDTYLMLRGPDGSSFDNDDDDDGSGTTNARLSLALPANGQYRLAVTSYQPGETGSYTLRSSGAQLTSAGGGSSNGGSGAVDAAGRITLGTPVNGSLAASDARLDSGEFYDAYTLSAEPGTRVEVSMRSQTVDTYLIARGEGGLAMENDDDPNADTTDSRLEFTVPPSGEVIIAATSYETGESGAYTLVAQRRGSSAQAPTAAAGTLTLGRTARGERRPNEADDTYTFTAAQGGPVRFYLASDDFDPILRLEGPGGLLAENDDEPSGDTLNSLIQANLPGPGTYSLVVSGYNEGEYGAYSLESSAGGNAPVPPPAPTPGSGNTLTIGGSVTGTLASGDRRLVDGEYADHFELAGRRGDRITIDMESADFDTFLQVNFPNGATEANDDRASGGRDSQLNLVLPEDGVYRLMATSYAGGETGRYTINVTRAAPFVAPDINDAATPRVFALSVGVADYVRTNPLPMTDRDAVKLSETLQTSGLLADGSVTLINEQATLENFRNSLAGIRTAMRPNDLLMIFFSGHGDKVQSERERDGSSETIELFDRELHDYELASMLEGLENPLLLVLDSCFAGGFNDVIDRDLNRMGIFSSEGDVLSQVAAKFQAGGYVSHLIQRAVSGEADTNFDHALTAGELAQFMQSEFYNLTRDEPIRVEVRDSRGRESMGYQHIVIDRGGDGMPYEQRLLVLR